MTTLGDLVLAGTHNSGAYNLDTTWKPQPSKIPLIRPLVSPWTLNQKSSIDAQLRDGIRYLDLTVVRDQQLKFWNSHLFATVPMNSIVAEILSFIREFPDQIIAINLETHFDRQDIYNANQAMIDFVNYIIQVWGEYISPISPWDLSVDHLVRRNFRIALTTENFTLWSEFQRAGISVRYTNIPWINTSNPQIKMNRLRENIQDDYVLAWTLSPQVSDVVLGLCGTGLEGLASNFNPRLAKFLDNLTSNQLDKISIITVDFYENSDVVDICQRLTHRKIYPHLK